MSSDFSSGVVQLDLRALRVGICELFTLAEIQILCFDLGIPYEELPGETLPNKAAELIGYSARRGRLQDLVAYVRKVRPNFPPIDTEAPVVSPTPSAEEHRSTHRRALRHARRDINLVHTLRPSPDDPDYYDILIYLIAHRDADISKVRYAEFFLGSAWYNHIFRASNQDGFLGISISAYGPVLCTCRVVFDDGHEVLLDRYIDFEMGEKR